MKKTFFMAFSFAIILSSCAKFPMKSALPDSNISYLVVTYNLWNKNSSFKLSLRNKETGTVYKTKFIKQRKGYLIHIPPGTYELIKIEIPAASTISVYEKDLVNVRNEIVIEPGSNYYLGTYRIDVTPGVPPKSKVVKKDNTIDLLDYKSFVREYGYDENSVKEIPMFTSDSLVFEKFGAVVFPAATPGF